MSRRRILLIGLAAAALVVGGYCYWSWDSTPAVHYVPANAPVVLRISELSSGLETSGYAERAAEYYPPIAPGLSPMDALGSECVIFVSEEGLSGLPDSIVVAARVNQKAKLAEVMGALVGKSQKVQSRGGNRLRMVKMKGSNRVLYYVRRGRTLIASLSDSSLDSVLGGEASAVPVSPLAGPAFELKASGTGIHALLGAAGARGLLPKSKLASQVREGAALVTAASLNGSLQDVMIVDGFIDILSIAGEMYQTEAGKSFVPRAMDCVPGDLDLCVSTNYPGLLLKIGMGGGRVERAFSAAIEYIRKRKSFRGSFTSASVRLGGGTARLLIVRTPKVIFPDGVEAGLMTKLGETVGESSYVGQLNEGPFYRIARGGMGGDGFAWFSGNTIVLASSEGALDAIAPYVNNPPEKKLFTEEGDLFVVANPLPEVLGRVRFRFVFRESRLSLSGDVRLRPVEGR